jgi:sec-independent protein translocase protein TatA
MFENIGGTEILIILLIIIVLFGAKKIPELAKGMGKGIKEFKKSVKEIKDDVDIKN